MTTDTDTGTGTRIPTPPALDALCDLVHAQIGRPVDSQAVAATLESRGIRDVDAVTMHGERDVFSLAERVYRASLDAPPPRARDTRGVQASTRRQKLAVAGRWYGQGAVKSLPIVLQTAAVVVLGYAMWSSLTFDRRLASTVAVATILSFLVTGGFVQAISELSVYYHEQRSYLLARTVSWRLLRLGVAVTVVAGSIGLLVEAVIAWVPFSLAVVGAAYYALLSSLWLILSILYAMQRHLAVIVAFALGTGVLTLMQLLTPLGIVAAHLTALSAAIAFAAGYAGWTLRHLARQADSTARLARLPRPALIAFGVAPHFCYGIVYFGFLFVDRLIGWSTGRHPLPIWLDTPYEYGLDVALLAFVLTLPQLEYSVHKFSGTLITVQESFDGADAKGHNAHFVRFYYRQVGALAVVGTASALLMWWLLSVLRASGGFLNLADPSQVTLDVFVWGVVGYLLLALGLMSGTFLFALSRPGPVLSALVLAVVVDVSVGWWLSREMSYWHSVIGMTTGALVFAVLTARAALTVLKRLDYYYYSAY